MINNVHEETDHIKFQSDQDVRLILFNLDDFFSPSLN